MWFFTRPQAVPTGPTSPCGLLACLRLSSPVGWVPQSGHRIGWLVQTTSQPPEWPTCVHQRPNGLRVRSRLVLAEPMTWPCGSQACALVKIYTRLSFVHVGSAHSLFRLWVRTLDINPEPLATKLLHEQLGILVRRAMAVWPIPLRELSSTHALLEAREGARQRQTRPNTSSGRLNPCWS